MFSSDIFNTKTIQTLGRRSLLGQGASGCVIKPPVLNEYTKQYVEYQNPGENDVAKLFRTELQEGFKAELKILVGIQKIDPEHIFTVALKGANAFDSSLLTDYTVLNCLEKDSTSVHSEIYQIIMENGGKELKQVAKSSIPYTRFIELFKTFILGIKKMHSNMLVHRDIKPVNVLLSDIKISLIDFGISDIAPNIYKKDSMAYLEYIYPFYPPEFYVASLLLKYRNDKTRFMQKLDEVMNTMQTQYFPLLFKDSQITGIRNQLQDFINHIKLHDYGYHDVFNDALAYKCDIYGIAFIIRELANKISYTSEKQKIVVYSLYTMCSEINPYKRASIDELIEFIQINIKNSAPELETNKIGAGRKSKDKQRKQPMRRLCISKIERNDCNIKTPPKCKHSSRACNKNLHKK
jgi:serine/threonine protein kinase